MTWLRQSATLGQPADSDMAEPGPTDYRRGGSGAAPGGGHGLIAPIFAAAVLVLTLALMIWAPWRDDRLALSDFGGRAETATAVTAASGPVAPGAAVPGTAPTRAAVAPTAVAAAGAGPAPAAATVAATGPGTRPVGLPLKRNDWIIVRDYVANGGPGPTGAIDVGVVGNRDAIGTPLYATHDGTVKVVRNTRLLGNLVVVRSGRWITTYGYLDQIGVTDGQTVRQGDQIGTLGRSGQASGPMVNYQVWEQTSTEEVNRNPMDFIAPR